MDRDDDEFLSERSPEHLEFRPTPEPIHEDVVSVDSWQRALRPHSDAMGIAIRVRDPASRSDGHRQRLAPGFFADDLAHSDASDAWRLRHRDQLVLSASRHARNA